MIENKLSELPKGWIWAKLEELVLDPKNDIVDGPFGSNLKASEYEDKGIPIIRLQNVKRNQFIKKNIRFINSEKAEQLERHSFSKSDIVITKLGAPLGEACLVPEDIEWGIIVADIVRVRTDDKYISKKYLVYCLNSDVVIKQFETNTKGTTRPRVNLNHIRQLELPISPLPEQHRIVTKIEELFTKLDVGVEVLKKTEEQLKLYRESVLQSAYEGKLVPPEADLAKSEGRSFESADVLLAHILKERRERLDKGAKYKEPKEPDTSGLPELPKGWCWTTIEQITELIGSGITPLGGNKNYLLEGVLFIRSQNVQMMSLDISNVVYISKELHEQMSRTHVHFGDVFLNITGASIGRVAWFNLQNKPANVNQHVCILRLVKKFPEWLTLCLASSFGQNQIMSKQSGATRQGLNYEQAKQIVIPLPPIAEQRRIVYEVERNLSVAEEAEKVVENSIREAERLHQTLLKKAFEGELVPQDSNDEPSSVLLARLKEERVKRKDLAHNVNIKIRGQLMEKSIEHERGIKIPVQLNSILQQSGKALTPNQLWELSELGIEEFYAQLKIEVQSGLIIEKRPNDIDVFLETAK